MVIYQPEISADPTYIVKGISNPISLPMIFVHPTGIYDIAGRKITNIKDMKKGVYIVNGKTDINKKI